MIHFDAVDFSERRSEEVMFLLTLSVVHEVITSGVQLWSSLVRILIIYQGSCL